MSFIIPSLTRVASSFEPLDPNEGMCLLTRNLATGAPVDPTRLFTIPGHNPEILTTVEYALGLPYNSLNLDDRSNIFHVVVDLRRLFNENGWLLLPSMELVERILDEHNTKQDITTLYGYARMFRYRFVPYGRKRIMALLRCSRDTLDEDATVTSEKFEYPFSNFPELESHVYPHWAILSAGRKLLDHEDGAFTTLATHVSEAYEVSITEAVEFLNSIESIYERWTTAVVPLS